MNRKNKLIFYVGFLFYLSCQSIAGTLENENFTFSNFRFSYIEKNNGFVNDSMAKYLMRTSNATIFFKQHSITYQFIKNPLSRTQQIEPESLEMNKISVLNLELNLLNSNPIVHLIPSKPLASKTNYFLGKDSSKWKTSLANYGELTFKEIYKDVDLIYYNKSGVVKYDFILAAKAKIDQIKFNYNGIKEQLSLNENGELIIPTDFGNFIESIPSAFQIIDGKSVEVNVKYCLNKDNSVGFKIGKYNSAYPLTIDPALQFSTFIGGSGDEVIQFGEMANDAVGNIYVTGNTTSANYPTTAGTFDASYNGSQDAFIFKLNSSGTSLLFSTYIGGNDLDFSLGIVLDAIGNVYLGGGSWSSNFPSTPGSYQPNHSIGGFGNGDAFALKFNSNCTALLWGTFIGGALDEQGHDICIGPNGNIYINGQAKSTLPTTPGVYQATNNGDYDYFVSILDSTGSTLIASTYVGGINRDRGNAIDVDATGNIYMAGYVEAGFTTTPGAFDVSFNGGILDLGVCKLNANCTTLIYSTFLGSGGDDFIYSALEVNSLGEAIICGKTGALNFPTTFGAYSTSFNGASDAFLSKLNSSGTALVFSTLFGGNGADFAYNLSVSQNGDIAVTGETSTNSFPTTACAYDQTYNGGISDAFVSVFNSNASALIYSTFIGGSIDDGGRAIYFDNNKASVFGQSGSSNFPTTSGVYDSTFNGGTTDIIAFQLDLNGSISIASITSVNKACSNDTIDVSSSGFTSYNWNFGDPLSGTLDSSNLQNASHLYTQAGAYTITLIASGLCYKDTVAKQITIDPVPIINATKDTSICAGKLVILTASGGTSYQWSVGATDTTAVIQVSPLVQTSYIVNASNGLCLGEADTVIVTPINIPLVSIQGKDSICIGESVTLTATGATDYVWSGDTSAITAVIIVSPISSSMYLLVGATDGCSSDTDTFTVNIYPPSEAAFSYKIDSCSGEVKFQNLSSAASSLNWVFGDGAFSSNTNPSHVFPSSGNYAISLITNPKTFCPDTFSLLIPIETNEGNIYVPNAFTPNGDGLNDEFSINSFNNCEYFQLQIYNRWGQLIYETEGYKVNWDGKSNSVAAPEGVYVYKLATDQTERNGHFTLIR